MNQVITFFCKLFLITLLFVLLDRTTAAFLRIGLDRYFGLDRAAKILCIGHSHTMLGIDRAALEQGVGVPVAKYALNGANVFDRLTMLKHYFNVHPDSVKVVVYDVDDHLFNYDGLSANSYKLFYPYLDNPTVADYLRKSGGSEQEILVRRVIATRRYSTLVLNLAIRGILGRDDNLKSGTVDIAALTEEIRRGGRIPVKVEPQAVRCLEETIRLVRSHGATLVLCYIPTVDVLNNMDPDRHRQVIERFRSYESLDSGVVFIDYNPRYAGRHELFADPIHLNGAGRKLVTNELAKDLSNQLLYRQRHL